MRLSTSFSKHNTPTSHTFFVVRIASRRGELLLGCMLMLTTGGACSGCGGSSVGEVEGSVHVNGELLTEGTVLFAIPEETRYIQADIRSDGTYRLAIANVPGVPIGRYRVAVTPPIQHIGTGQSAKATPEWDRLSPDSRYTSVETSGLECDVRLGFNRYDIDIP